MKKNLPGSAVATPAATPPLATSSHVSSPSPGPGASGTSDDLSRKVAEAKRRVAEAQSKLAVKDNPYMVRHIMQSGSYFALRRSLQSLPQTGKNKNKPPEPAQQGAGLKMAAHPLLLDNTVPAPQSKKDRYKPMQPKFASIKVR